MSEALIPQIRTTADSLTKKYLQSEPSDGSPSPGGEGLRVRANRNIKKAQPISLSWGCGRSLGENGILFLAGVRANRNIKKAQPISLSRAAVSLSSGLPLLGERD